MKAGRRRCGISKAFQMRGRTILYRPTGERAEGRGQRDSAQRSPALHRLGPIVPVIISHVRR
jgi:hypothetical protein